MPSLYIPHYFFVWTKLFLVYLSLPLYCWLFYDLTTMFFANLQFVYRKAPPSSIGQFFSIWTPIFSTINKFFTFTNSNCKMTTKKGHDDTTENQCMSCPISKVSVLTRAGGYKLFSGLLYWSEISVSGGWMLCTIHKLFNCLLSFLDSIISNVGREICWSM